MDEMRGYKLEFISQILRDGSGTIPIKKGYKSLLNKQTFSMQRLSMTEDTYIASDFNSFVVRIKPKYKPKY